MFVLASPAALSHTSFHAGASLCCFSVPAARKHQVGCGSICQTLRKCNLFGSCAFLRRLAEEAGPSAPEQSAPQTYLAFCCSAGALAQKQVRGFSLGTHSCCCLITPPFSPLPSDQGVLFYSSGKSQELPVWFTGLLSLSSSVAGTGKADN